MVRGMPGENSTEWRRGDDAGMLDGTSMDFRPRRRPFPTLIALLGIAVVLSAAAGVGRADESSLPAVVPVPAKPARIRYEGTVWLEGHFRRPHETRPLHSVA